MKNAYIIKCDDVVLDDDGNVTEVLCSYIPESRSGDDTSGIKCKGTIHWVNASDAVDVEIRNYDYLLKDAEFAGQDFNERMNYDSVHILKGKAEPYIATVNEGTPFQLLRKGYYKKTVKGDKLVLSQIVTMKDSFKKS